MIRDDLDKDWNIEYTYCQLFYNNSQQWMYNLWGNKKYLCEETAQKVLRKKNLTDFKYGLHWKPTQDLSMTSRIDSKLDGVPS